MILRNSQDRHLIFILSLRAFFHFRDLIRAVKPTATLRNAANIFIGSSGFAVFGSMISITNGRHVDTRHHHCIIRRRSINQEMRELAFVRSTFFGRRFFGRGRAAFNRIRLTEFFVRQRITFTLRNFKIFFFLASRIQGGFVRTFVRFQTIFY